LGLALGALAILASEAKAGLSVNNIGLYDGKSNAPTAWVSYTGSKGFVDVYADPQTATNWVSNGQAIALYCIDLIHANTLGVSYAVNPTSNPTWSTPPRFTDAANRVAWALENVGSSANARGATQLLIWMILDKNFTVNWAATNNAGLHAAYTSAITQMTSAYNAHKNYVAGAEFLSAVHDPTGTLNQDLAFAVPEPSTLVVAGLSALGFIGYGLRRRARSQV
jgi:hypothetical protein